MLPGAVLRAGRRQMTGEPPAEGSLDSGALLVMGALAEVDPPGEPGDSDAVGLVDGVVDGVPDGVLDGVGLPLDVEGVGFGGFGVGLPEVVGIPSGVSRDDGFPPGVDEPKNPGEVTPGLGVEPSVGTSASRPFSVSSSFAD